MRKKKKIDKGPFVAVRLSKLRDDSWAVVSASTEAIAVVDDSLLFKLTLEEAEHRAEELNASVRCRDEVQSDSEDAAMRLRGIAL